MSVLVPHTNKSEHLEEARESVLKKKKKMLQMIQISSQV